MKQPRWYLAVAIAMLAVVIGAEVFWVILLPSRLEALALWVAFVAVLAAIYRDTLQYWLWPAILTIEAKMPKESIWITPVNVRTNRGEVGQVPGFFYQIYIRNEGPATASQLCVMIERMEQWVDKDWKAYPSLPMNLTWAHRPEDPFYPYLPKGVRRACTLGNVKEPGNHQIFFDGRSDKYYPVNETRFELELEVRPTAEWYKLEAGKYKLHLAAAARNGTVTRKELVIVYSGRWPKDTERLQEQLEQMISVS
jgi:hypothetical protein